MNSEVGLAWLRQIVNRTTPSHFRWAVQSAVKTGLVDLKAVQNDAALYEKMVADLKHGKSRGFLGEFGSDPINTDLEIRQELANICYEEFGWDISGFGFPHPEKFLSQSIGFSVPPEEAKKKLGELRPKLSIEQEDFYERACRKIDGYLEENEIDTEKQWWSYRRKQRYAESSDKKPTRRQRAKQELEKEFEKWDATEISRPHNWGVVTEASSHDVVTDEEHDRFWRSCMGAEKENLEIGDKTTVDFVNADAGAGKSTVAMAVLLYICTLCRFALVLSPTGIAAMNLGGRTVHKFLNLKIDSSLWANWWDFLEISKIPYASVEAARQAVAVFVDEVQAAYSSTLDALDHFLRFVKRIDLPFGGLPCFLFGDGKQKLIQLPIANPSPYDYLPHLICASDCWPSVRITKLVENQRLAIAAEKNGIYITIARIYYFYLLLLLHNSLPLGDY